jgi:hypothetical protein
VEGENDDNEHFEVLIGEMESSDESIMEEKQEVCPKLTLQ